MCKIIILIKSPNASTYKSALISLRTKYPEINEFEFVFFKRNSDSTLIPLLEDVNYKRSSITVPKELIKTLKNTIAVDISGLPKEDFALIFPLLIERRTLRIHTLTRGENGESLYMDLVEKDSLLYDFRHRVFLKTMFFRCILILICLAVIILLIGNYINNPALQMYSSLASILLTAISTIPRSRLLNMFA